MPFKQKRAMIWIPALLLGTLNFLLRVIGERQTPLHAGSVSLVWIGGWVLSAATCIWLVDLTQR